MCVLGVVILDRIGVLFTMVYIPSCDTVAHVYLGSSVGRPHALRAKSRGFESRPGQKKKKRGFFSFYFYCILISKDGCEKGRGTPRSWT